jgi:WD40 repeat protein
MENLDQEQQAIIDLSQLIRDKSCILFGGAGLSAAAGFPTWREFTSLVTSRFVPVEGPSETPLTLPEGDLDILFQVALSDHREQIMALLRDTYGSVRKPSPLHESLAGIDFAGIITSNWDRLLESAFPDAAVVYPEEATTVQSLNLKNSLFLLRLAGGPDKANSFIVSRQDLERSLATNSALISALDTLLQSNSLFFVGCGWDEIEAFFRGTRYFNPAVPHFALIAREGSTWQARARRFEEIYGLHSIPIESVTQMQGLLTQLSESRGGETTLTGHTQSVVALAIVPGDRFLSGSEDGTIRLWNKGLRTPLLTLLDATESGSAVAVVNSVAASPDGMIAISGSSDGRIRIWDLNDGHLLNRIQAHNSEVYSVALFGDPPCVASSGDDKLVKLWKISTGDLSATFEVPPSPPSSTGKPEPGIKAIAVANRRIYAGSQRIIVWDIDGADSPALYLRSHSKPVDCLAVSPASNKLVSGSQDMTIIIWDLETGGEERKIEVKAVVSSVAVSPDGTRIVSGSNDGRLQVWDLATGQLIQTIDAHRAAILSLAITADNLSVISGSDDSTIKIWKLPEKTLPLVSARFENIGPFDDLLIEFKSNWTILLGNNGVGKSTMLRALALALVGKDAGNAAAEGIIGQTRLKDGLMRSDGIITVRTANETYKVTIRRTVEGGIDVEWPTVRALEREKILILGFPPMRSGNRTGNSTISLEDVVVPTSDDLLPLVQGVVDMRLNRLKEWILGLRVRTDKKQSAQSIPDDLFKKLHGLLEGTALDLSDQTDSSRGVMVQTDDGVLPIEQISQGMTSLISWVGILWQRLFEVYGPDSEDRIAVVLMDEIDAHMHPLWQQLLVTELQNIFPNVQFIATTHSPLIVAGRSRDEVVVCMRDSDTKKPIVTRLGIDYEGLRADQILTSAAFGLAGARDVKTVRRQNNYHLLITKPDPTPEDLRELERLRDDEDFLLLPLDETLDADSRKREAREKLRSEWLARPSNNANPELNKKRTSKGNSKKLPSREADQ